MSANALTTQSGTITSANPVELSLITGESYLLIVGLDGDNFNSQSITPELWTGVNGGATAQGSLTVDTQPTKGDTLTIDETVYTFVDVNSQTSQGDIALGSTLLASQANIVAAINGEDGYNESHPTVTVADFSSDVAVITAIKAGTSGNSIATTETFTAGTNVFDAATLGTTTAGTDDYSGEVIALPEPGSADSNGSPQTFAALGMMYLEAGLPKMLLTPSGAITSVRYFLTKVGTNQSFSGLA